MKNLPLLLLLLLPLFGLSGCITIIWGSPTEKATNYPVDSTATISSLIEQYLPIKTDSNKNYVLVFWDSGCPHSNWQMKNMNYLYEKYNKQYRFIACTNETLKAINKNHKKLKIKDQYIFESFTEIWGLKSSIRNIEYNNQAPLKGDYVPMNFVIQNDSIIYKRGGIEDEKSLQKFEDFLSR